MAAFPPAASALVGALTPVGSPPGCLAETDAGGLCTDGFQVSGPIAVTASPDGKSLYVAARTSNAIDVLTRNPTTGVVNQLAGPEGCLSTSGSAGLCTDIRNVDNPSSIAVSPDGKFAYVASRTADSITVFSRKLSNGALTQFDGTSGCVSDNGSSGRCADGKGLDGVTGVVVSPDGASLYAVSLFDNSLVIFKRNPTTGVLTQLTGRAGCIRQTGSAGACGKAGGLLGPLGVTVSSDNKSVYVASLSGDAVAAFSRDTTTGQLSPLAGTAGCVSEDGSAGACVDGVALDGAASVVVSPNGRSLYVASTNSDAIAAFARNRTTGELSQLPGTSACVSEDGTGGLCADGVGLDGAASVASAGNNSLYAASLNSDAVTAFARNSTTGTIAQLGGASACISEDGSGGACVDGVGLDGAAAIVVPKGLKSAYAAGSLSNTVGSFSRNTTTGALAQLTTLVSGCTSATGSGGLCSVGVAFADPRSVVVSPNGKNAYAAATGSNALLAFKRDPGTGELTQLPGTAGCVSDDGSGGECADGFGLAGPLAVAVTPDGKTLYAASLAANTIAVFKRNGTTGALAQLAGPAGCVSEDGSGGACADGVGLVGPDAIAVSPDSTSVYVASAFSDAVTVFKRNTTTGALSQFSGAGGCISEDGTGGACLDGIALDGPSALAVSPNGKSLYVAATNSDAVAAFKRASNGALTQLAGKGACVNTTGGPCTNGDALDGPVSVAVAPGNKSVYVASVFSDAVAVLARASSGALAPQDCVSDTAAGDCAKAKALDGPASVAVSPDRKSLYVASAISDALVVFARDTATGGLRQLSGTAGCISEDGFSGKCIDGRGLDGAGSVTVSPDSDHVYVVAVGSDALTAFVREH